MSYPNWLGDSTVSLPNNNIVIGGVPVNVVANVVGTKVGVTNWTSSNFVPFFTQSNVAPGSYLCGMEIFTNALTASNAGNGWNQGDLFVARVTDVNAADSAGRVQNFIRPYTTGVAVGATSPYNKGGTDSEAVGVLIVPETTDLRWEAQFVIDTTTSYPKARSLTIEAPWYQKIA